MKSLVGALAPSTASESRSRRRAWRMESGSSRGGVSLMSLVVRKRPTVTSVPLPKVSMRGSRSRRYASKCRWASRAACSVAPKGFCAHSSPAGAGTAARRNTASARKQGIGEYAAPGVELFSPHDPFRTMVQLNLPQVDHRRKGAQLAHDGRGQRAIHVEHRQRLPPRREPGLVKLAHVAPRPSDYAGHPTNHARGNAV